MPMTGRQLIEHSVESWQRAQDEALTERYLRLADHYDQDLQGLKYFPKYYRETEERYQKRPKKALPLCSGTVDVLAGAMVGDGVQVTIGDPDSRENKAYQDIQRHNDLDGANALALAQVAGVFGWCAERIILEADRRVEFERVNPLYFGTLYDHGAIGRTVKRPQGITFSTFYDADRGVALPRDTSLNAPGKAMRTEVITPAEWWVLLDGEVTPVDPADSSNRWMPRDDGANPYGVIPATLLWNIHHISQFEGRADIDPGFKMAEDINLVYSQMLYNLQMAFPTLTIPKSGAAGSASMALGLGLALEYPLDGPAPGWIAPPFDVDTFMGPLKAMLTLFFSMVHTPASAHGLGTIFGQQSYESGKAKFYEMGPLTKHVRRKRTNFRGFIEQRWRNLCAVLNAPAPYGHGLALDADVPVSVDFPTDMVPESEEEVLERIIKRLKANIISDVEAILADRSWEDTPENREKVQQVLDDIGQAATAKQPVRPLDAAIRKQLAGE